MNRSTLPAAIISAAILVCGLGQALGQQAQTQPADWPQLQHDAARTGFTADTVKAPYRARWVWLGPEVTLRNKLSKDDPQWKDDLAGADGKDYAGMPKSVPFSFAGSMQPIVAGKNVYVGDAQGTVYAINLDDGSTVWKAANPGGTFWPGVADEKVVAFPSLQGFLTGFSATDGKQLWQIDTGKAITSSPALSDGVVYAASQNGCVYAVQLADGKPLWKSDYLGAPIQGGLCVAGGKVYTGTEAMEALALDAKTGKVLARQKLMGQSFRMEWPVAIKDRVVFTAVPVICVGSEYVNDAVLAGKPGQRMGWVSNAKSGYADSAAEDDAKRKWLAGDDGKYWETTFALKADTLAKDYVIAMGATEGCGTPPEPPTLDAQGRPLVWWATAYPTLTKPGTFGSSYAMDLSPFDLATGKRIPIDNKRFSGQTTETDNLYGMAVGGDTVFLRQNFRGTWSIDLKTSVGMFISAVYRFRDGGAWPAAITYAQREDGPVKVPETPADPAGRVAPAVAGGKLIFTENFGVTCVESGQKGD